MLWWPEPALDIERGHLFALWLSWPYQRWGLLLSCWSRGPPICFLASYLQWEVKEIGVLSLGGKPLSTSPLELFTYGYALLCHLLPVVWTLRLHCCSTALGFMLTVSMLVIVLVSLRCCFHQSSRADPLKSGPRIAVIMDLDPLWALWALWEHLRFWSGQLPHVMCPRSLQLLKLDMFWCGVLTVHSNVL